MSWLPQGPWLGSDTDGEDDDFEFPTVNLQSSAEGAYESLEAVDDAFKDFQGETLDPEATDDVAVTGDIIAGYTDPGQRFSFRHALRTAMVEAEQRGPATPAARIAEARGEREVPEGDPSDPATQEEFARIIQERFIDSEQRIATATQEAVDLPDEDFGTGIDIAGREIAFNPAASGRAVGSLTGFVAQDILAEPILGTFAAGTGIDPSAGRIQGDIMAERPQGEREPTGEIDVEPSLLETLALDLGAIGLGRAIGGAARGLRGGGEARAAEEAGQELGSLSAREGTEGTMAIGSILRGGSRVFGPAADAVRSVRFADDVPTTVPSPRAAQADEFIQAGSFDEFLRATPTDVGGPFGRAGRVTDTFVEEAGPTARNIDDFFEGTLPRSVDDIDLGGRNIDEGGNIFEGTAASATSRLLDDIPDFGGTVSRATDDAAGNIDELFASVRGAGDEVVGGATRSLDDVQSAVTGTARQGEEFGPLARSGQEAAEEAAGGGGGGVLNFLFGTRRRIAATLGTLTLGAGLAGFTLIGDREGGGVTYRQVDTFTHSGQTGIAIEIARGDATLGYTVYVSQDQVLTTSAGATNAAFPLSTLSSGPPDDRTLRARFDSLSQARNAFQQWAESGGSTGVGGASGQSDVWDGSISAPSSVPQGEGFGVEATVRNTTDSEQAATFVLGVAVEGDNFRLASQSARLAGRAGQTLTFNVAQRTRRLQAGDYSLILVAQGDGAGTIAESGLTVTGGDDGAGEEEWEYTRLGQLGEGWYLIVRRRIDGSEEEFIVAGKREDETRIYLRPGGRVVQSPFFFDSRNAAEQAFQAWLQRHRNGETDASETPSTSGSGPSAEGVRRDSAGRGGTAAENLKDLMTSRAGFVILLGLAVAIWYASDGEPVKWLKSQWRQLKRKVT